MPKVSYSQTKLNMYPNHQYADRTVNGTFSVLYDVRTMSNYGQTTKTGYRDTDWKVKISKRSDASSSYDNIRYVKILPTRHSFIGETQLYDGVKKAFINGKHVVRDYHLWHYNQLASGLTDAALRDMALARFKRKLAGKLDGAELLVPTVELREVRGSITHLAEFTGKFLVTMDDLVRKKKASSLVKFMQENWLAYSLGISPMLSDVRSALKAVNNYFDRPTSLHRIEGSARSQRVFNKVGDSDSSIGWMSRTSSQVESTLVYKFVAGIDFKLITGNNYGIGDHLGFNDFWSNLPSLGWELLPFSWVADYFTTMGDFLSDTFVLPPGSTKYMTETRYCKNVIREKRTHIPTRWNVGWTNHHQQHSSCMDGYGELHSMSRVVLSQLPHRSLRFKTQDEIGRNAVNRLLNLASLVNFKASEKLQRQPRKLRIGRTFSSAYEHL